MLEEAIGWIGKLPNYADFIQSKNLGSIQRSLMNWLSRGQDHIGEQFIKTGQVDGQLYVYYFFLESFISDNKRIQGILFSSHDSRGRKCPFIIFSHNLNLQPVDMIFLFSEKLQALGLKWESLSTQLDETFLSSLVEPLSHLNSKTAYIEDMDSWYELYPKAFNLNFKIESTNHVIYRKLLIR